MKIKLLRHATLLIEFKGKQLLLDPMLSRREAMDPIMNSPNIARNPLVDIAVPPEEYLHKADGVLLTHTHRDHFDDAAAALIPKELPVLCQPQDEAKLTALGFKMVIAVEEAATWEGIRLYRTAGRHGTGEIGEKMAPVSGFVLAAAGEPTLYIAGDTIYCAEVEAALRDYRPAVAVVNAGGARFVSGDPITMTAADVASVAKFAPQTRVVAVHMEAINHCLVTRSDLREHLLAEGLIERVSIPADGEVLSLPVAR